MFTKEKIQSIRQEFSDAEGEKAEVFDVMYANFDKLLDIAAAAPDLLEACKYALKQAGLSVDGPTYKKLLAAITAAEGGK